MAEELKPYHPDDEGLRRIYGENRTVAVVGLSPNEDRDSHRVARYLQRHGFKIIPVNPKADQILGEKSFPSLGDIPEPVDVVDVFRRAEHTPEIAEGAVKIGAKVLWLQEGIVSDDAGRIAEEGGLEVVMGICMMAQHRRLFPEGAE